MRKADSGQPRSGGRNRGRDRSPSDSQNSLRRARPENLLARAFGPLTRQSGSRSESDPYLGLDRRRWRLPGIILTLAWITIGSTIHAGDLAGHYVVADSAPPAPDAAAAATPNPEVDNGTLDLAPKRHGYAVTWHPADGGRRRRGLGLRDGDDLLAVSVATGGAAYGVQVYRRPDKGAEWRGPWLTSIDGAGTVGEIAFRTEGGPLTGRHPMTCRRPGAGGFEGELDIAAREGGDYLVTFYLGHNLLYRGLGALVGETRFAVAWSFGSPPALAVYRIGADGLFTGRRVSWHAGQTAATDERLARAGPDAARLLPSLVRGSAGAEDSPQPAYGSLTESDSALLGMMEPGAPTVKSWNYDELQRRYAQDGWAGRWLSEQLTPEETALLRSALKRRDRARSRGKASPDDRQTIGQWIEAERRRTADDD